MSKPHYRATANGPRFVRDGLVNFATGLAVLGQSKAASGTYQFSEIPREVLAAAYRSSWLVKAAVDMPIDDAMSGRRLWQGEPDIVAKIEAEEKRLDLYQKIDRAKKLGYRDGGAAIFMDTGASDLAKPIEEKLSAGRLRKLIVFPRREMAPGPIERDINADGYGRPQHWTISSTGLTGAMRIHPSRFAFLLGDTILDENMSVGSFPLWGDSILECRLDTIRDAESVIANIAELVYEANVDVLGIEGLMQLMASGKEEDLLRRLQIMRQGKSNSKMLVRDAAETYDRKSINFAGLPAVLQEVAQVAAGAIKVPATRVWGRAPAGMNATGEGDEQIYLSRLAVIRGEIERECEGLDNAMIYSALGARPEELSYEWPPFKQKSAQDKAEIGKKIAEKWEVIGRTGNLTAEEARAGMTAELIEAGVAPGLEAAMAETEENGGFDLGQDDPDDDVPDPDAPDPDDEEPEGEDADGEV